MAVELLVLLIDCGIISVHPLDVFIHAEIALYITHCETIQWTELCGLRNRSPINCQYETV